MIPSFLLPPEIVEMQRRQIEATKKRLIEQTPLEPWTTDIKWKPALHIDAASYQHYVFDLFPEEPVGIGALKRYPAPGELGGCSVISPTGRFCYLKRLMPPYALLDTYSGRRRGYVFFNGPVLIPALFERSWASYQTPPTWYSPDDPWMSLTPMELLTLRPGVRAAKGHTIIAGMGLGWQLIEVSHKPTVKAITLVEQNRELLSWLLPRVQQYMDPRVPLYVIAGNAYEIVPEMTADVALIDIFPGFGHNKHVWKNRTKHCPGIKKVWVWG